jgi:hypothetical protein
VALFNNITDIITGPSSQDLARRLRDSILFAPFVGSLSAFNTQALLRDFLSGALGRQKAYKC